MVNREINLLSSLPKSKRDIKKRAEGKNEDVIKIAKQFGFDYFDGDRRYGYGGYWDDGRWGSVAKDIIKFFDLKKDDKILDIGCAKGFLVWSLCQERMDACGIDISTYAIMPQIAGLSGKLKYGTAETLTYPDKSFDLVLSINALHNLPRAGVIKALKEIERVGKGNSYIVVDSYKTPEEKAIFESWCLTAETHMYPHEWLELFEEAGYKGNYSWNIL